MLGCESTFNGYWLADECRERQLPFVLGHALYLKAIHGGKVKNDKLDSEKLALLLRGGNFTTAYAYEFLPPRYNTASTWFVGNAPPGWHRYLVGSTGTA